MGGRNTVKSTPASCNTAHQHARQWTCVHNLKLNNIPECHKVTSSLTRSSSSDVGLFVVSFVRHWSMKLMNRGVLQERDETERVTKSPSPKHTHINTRAEQCSATTWCRLTISWSASVWVEGFSGSERGLSWDAYYRELCGWVGVYVCVCRGGRCGV